MSPLRTPKISERECVGRFGYQKTAYQRAAYQQVKNPQVINQEVIDQRLNSLPAHFLRL